MKKNLHVLILLFLFFCFSSSFKAYSQCDTGETEVSIVVHTDNYGSEVTWSLTGPEGSPSYITGGPYSDNSEHHDEQIVCVPEGAELVFTINDSYGDGICAGEGDGYYSVSVYDFTYAQGCNYGSVESTTFLALPPPNTNLIFDELLIPNYVQFGDVQIDGVVRNYGVDNITSYDVNWTINDGSVNTYTVSGIDIATNEIDTFNHATPWNTSDSLEFFHLNVWTSNPNGISDENPSNDTLAKEIYVLNKVAQRLVLIEHFTNASCPPCASQNPILDAVMNEPENLEKVSHLAYHTSWPGTDPMFYFNFQNDQKNIRVPYYGVSGVPNAVLAGNKFQGSPVGINTEMIAAEYERPGLFNINIDPVFVNDSIITVELDITSLAEFKEGSLKAHVVLIQDLEYETAPGTNGEKSFPDVMRYMITGVDGIDIGLPKHGDVFSTIVSQELDTAVMKDIEIIVFIQNDDNKDIHMVSVSTPDITFPFMSLSPFNGELNVAHEPEISITFKDPVRLINDDPITDPASLITFKKDNQDGEDVAFTASINDDKTQISVVPDVYLDPNQAYIISIGALIEDENNTAVEESSSTFITDEYPTPIVTITPEDGALRFDRDADIIISFDMEIRLINDDPIIDPASFVSLKKIDENGEDIPFTASINSTNDTITIDPDVALGAEQVYYVSIEALVENKFDIAIEDTSITFTTGLISGIHENDLSIDLTIYPNPFKDVLNLSYFSEKPGKSVIEIYNQSGMLVKTKTQEIYNGKQLLEINTDDMSNGIYFLNLKINNDRISKKIVLLR